MAEDILEEVEKEKLYNFIDEALSQGYTEREIYSLLWLKTLKFKNALEEIKGTAGIQGNDQVGEMDLFNYCRDTLEKV